MTYTILAIAIAAFVSASGANAQTAPPDDLVRQAQRLESDGKLTEALAVYEQSATQEPARFDAHLGIGRVLDLQGRYGDARLRLQKAIELAPDASQNQALSAMAVSYVFEGNAGEAAKYLQKIFDRQLKVGANDGAAGTANALGRVYLETGDAASAEKWYRTGHQTAAKIANIAPADTDLWEMRWQHAQGRIAARRKQFDAAQKHVEAVRTIVSRGTLNEGQLAAVPYLAGYVVFYQGNYDVAIAELSKGDQEDPFVLSLLAQAYEQKKDDVKARELYGKILQMPDHNLQAAFSRPLAQRRVTGR